MNSSLGIISLLGVRIPKSPGYPRWSIEGLKVIPIPDLGKSQITKIVKVYNKLAKKKIGLWKNENNSVRVEIDTKISKILKIKKNDIDQIRHKLSMESMVIGNKKKESEKESKLTDDSI